MRILAFDTATSATAVALLDDGLELEARDDPPPGQRPRHTTRLLPLIVELLERSRSSWEQLDRIAVGVGPGTFTGLRIGIATAHALARARGIPLVGVSTLRSIALNPDAEDRRAVAAILDARRGEAFAAAWESRSGIALLAPAALRPEQLVEALAAIAPPLLAIGDGAVEFRQVLERSGASVPKDSSELHRVTALNHGRLARDLPAQDPAEVRPEYLRAPDAELARRAVTDQ